MKRKLALFSATFFTLIASTSFVRAQMHYPSTLINEFGGQPISAATTKCAILIHGWNPGANTNCYASFEWSNLLTALRGRLNGSGWGVVAYDWHEDAATGGIFTGLWNFDYVHASAAAFNADAHGVNLAIQLNQLSPNLREVHFIAHSAGSWAARAAAKQLLLLNPYVVVQVTLLDPFVPDPGNWLGGGFSDNEMNGMQFISGNDRIQRLENYYADDSPTHGWNALPGGTWAGPTYYTQEQFSWRSGIDISQEIDWGAIDMNPPLVNVPFPPYLLVPSVTFTPNYDWHSGPIQFYSDCISASLFPSSVPSGLQGAGCPFDYQQIGWRRSLFAWEPFLPQITVQPVNQSAQAGNSASFSVTASQATDIAWYKVGGNWVGAGAVLTLDNVSASNAGSYVARLGNANGQIYSQPASLTVGAAPAPTTTSVSPTSLPTSPSTQLINIYGANFKAAADANASSLIFRDPANNLYLRTPIFVSASQLQYNITVQSAVGTWSVTVTNAGLPASNPQTFTVATPPPNTGSLVVNLAPAGAIAAGAQWRVDGGSYRNSGDTATDLTPGSHTVSFKAVAGYTAPTDHTATITSGAVANDSGNYTAVTTSTYTLTLNQGGSMGSISASPFGTWNGSAYVYTAGSVVQLTASANPGYHFVSWSGDVTGTANPTPITINGNKSVTANFASGDPNMGTVIVTIQPPEAAAAGVTWGWNATDYRASGTAVTTWPGTYILTVHPVDGWLGQSVLFATITAGQTSNYTVTFTPDTTPGLLTVTLSPPDAVTAGAKWHVNGGAAQGNGATVSLPPGNGYTITFDSVPGWTAPPSQTVAVQRAQTTVVAGNYVPPAGQPAIVSVSPAIGSMSGGTLLTINGVNFTAPATVLIGGRPATNVVVASATQITCVAPAGSAYGSTNVVLLLAGGSATNANAFAYGPTSGNKLDLIGTIGGSCFCVAAQGNYLYAGQGRKMLVLDVSSPSTASKVGQVAIPGVVRSIALFGHYAYIASQEGGVQVVDISSPANPTLCGAYRAAGYTWTTGIAIFGGVAYVANENLGLQILDLGNPTAPALLSATNIGSAVTVVVKASASGVFAYVSTLDQLCVVDVSTPSLPRLRGQTAIPGGYCNSVAILGNYVMAASRAFGNLEIIDVSNPDLPLGAGKAPGIRVPSAVAIANNYVYAVSSLSGQGFYVFSLSGGVLTQVGNLPSLSAFGFNMALNGSTAYVPDKDSGLKVVNISNPTAPSQLATFNDSGVFKSYESVAVTQNSMAACGYPMGTITGFNTVFDVSNPGFPAFAANPNAGGELVVARNGIAYVLTGSSNAIFNVSTPTSPYLLKQFSHTAVPAMNMSLAGNILYIVGCSGADQPYLATFDISSPSSPAFMGNKTFTEYASGVAGSIGVAGTKALMGVQVNSPTVRFEVVSLDLSNRSSPVKSGTFTNVASYPIAIELSPDGNFGYVLRADPPSALLVLDASQPTALSMVSNIPIDSASGTGLRLAGNELIASTFMGIYVFDISNPGSPLLTRSYELSEAQGVSVSTELPSQRGNIYVADLDGGLVVLREQDIQVPSVYITNPTFSPVYTNATSTISLGGGSDDNQGVTAITWANNRGGSGSVNAPFDNWFVSGVALQPGTNLLTVTAFDAPAMRTATR